MSFPKGDGEFHGKAGTLKFKFQPSRSDRRHLTVVFSGHRARGTVDFESAASNIRTAVLWIYDDFGPDSRITYYLSDAGEHSPIELVGEFLAFALSSMDLSPRELACVGFSKGASAALYFGLLFDSGSIIATVPPIWPGTAARKRSPEVFAGMIDRELAEDDETKRIDNLIPSLIRGGAGVSSAIYVLTSETDPRYWEQVEPNLALLEQLPGLTMIKYSSEIIRGHSDVTPYAMPTVLGLLYLHADGFKPEFASKLYSNQTPDGGLARGQLRGNSGIARLTAVPFRDGRMFLEMDTLIRGFTVDDYGIMERSLVLTAVNGRRISFPLSTNKNSILSRRYLSETFVDYSACISVTHHGLGIPLSSMPRGKHTISVALRSIANTTIFAEPPLAAADGLKLPRFLNDGERIVTLKPGKGGLEIEVLTPDDLPDSPDLAVSINLFATRGASLTLQGAFSLPGAIVESWGDATVRLIVTSSGASRLFPLGLLDRPDWSPSSSLRKAAFGDMRGEGVDLGSLSFGSYELSLLVMSAHRTAKSTSFARLEVSEVGLSVVVLEHGTSVRPTAT